jgi:hypothetical protein
MTATARPDGPAPAVLRIPLVDLARAAVTQVVPEQKDYFELVTAAWDDGVRPSGGGAGWTGGSVRSGVDPSVLSDVIYPLLTGTIAQIVGAAGFAGLRRKRWWRRSRKQVTSAVVEVPISQLDQVREVCVTHGTTLGLSVAEATMLADAVYGVLRSRGDGN